MAKSFSDILAAVKPAKRTDQMLILAAMYHLGATAKSVSVGDISAVFELQSIAVPVNLSARLRKYLSLVEPTTSSPPILWRLKKAGVDRLNDMTGLSLTSPNGSNAFGIDIGFVCALEAPEFQSLRDAFGGASAWTEVASGPYSHVYRTTTIRTQAGRPVSVVATVSTSMGLTAAAIATSQLIARFKPRFVVMTGIAAGTRSGNKQFGDILVADPSIDYNSGKVVQENGIASFQPDPYPIALPPRLRSQLKRFASDAHVFSSIAANWVGDRPAHPNRAHIGPLGAADQVIDNPQIILQLQQNWRKLIGVEMETYAVYRACLEAPEPKPLFASFKAVCDFAAEKTDSWQPYAAYMAAHFAKSFIEKRWEDICHENTED